MLLAGTLFTHLKTHSPAFIKNDLTEQDTPTYSNLKLAHAFHLACATKCCMTFPQN